MSNAHQTDEFQKTERQRMERRKGERHKAEKVNPREGRHNPTPTDYNSTMRASSSHTPLTQSDKYTQRPQFTHHDIPGQNPYVFRRSQSVRFHWLWSCSIKNNPSTKTRVSLQSRIFLNIERPYACISKHREYLPPESKSEKEEIEPLKLSSVQRVPDSGPSYKLPEDKADKYVAFKSNNLPATWIWSCWLYRNNGRPSAKPKEKEKKVSLICRTCLCFTNFIAWEETQWRFHRVFEGYLREGGGDRGVVGRRCDHCVSRFLMTLWFRLIPVSLGLWVQLVLEKVQYVFRHIRCRFRGLISFIVHWDCHWIRRRCGS